MITSTKFWFRFIRLRLAVGMLVAFVPGLLVVLNDPPFEAAHLLLVPYLGLIIAWLMGLHSVLAYTMFPATDRQVAWIPMAGWALTILGGALGAIAGQILVVAFDGRYQFDRIVSYWVAVLWVWPPVLYLLLMLWRLMRLNPVFVFFAAFVPQLMNASEHGGELIRRAIDLYFAAWPLWSLGCMFFVWEAPRHVAMVRRFDYQETPAGLLRFKVRTPQMVGPARPSLATRLGDLLTGIGVAVMILLMYSSSDMTSSEQVLRNPFYVLLVILVMLIPIRLMVELWRANRASGMSPERAFGVLLIEMTGVGYAFRDWIGVARGAVVRCGSCRGWRLAWQAECPSCHTEPADAPQPSLLTTGIRAQLLPTHDQGAFGFRVIGPIILIGNALIINLSRWFGG